MTIEGSGREGPAASADDASSPAAPPGGVGQSPRQRRITRAQVARFVQAVRDSDRAVVDEMVLRLARSRPWLAPLALAVGAFAMLLDGVKLLFTNWRLTLIQVLPAMWIWAAMYDLKLHLSPLHNKSLRVFTGPAVVIPLVLAIAVITVASFYLNAVFAFAIIQPGRPQTGRPSARPGHTCPSS